MTFFLFNQGDAPSFSLWASDSRALLETELSNLEWTPLFGIVFLVDEAEKEQGSSQSGKDHIRDVEPIDGVPTEALPDEPKRRRCNEDDEANTSSLYPHCR